ncbi:MAG: 5-bromo-4-chloroindolyl phosphate hydrolysis family protein [Bacilli bacterium]|nr:5-bromo-4-chloroindolyl phosphate hydrolysis family protein [Bacilli bacterium]
MKGKEIVSGVVGASFFALGYLGLSVALVPSLVIGAGAYVASELVMKGPESGVDKIEDMSLKKRIEIARKSNKHISEMENEIDSLEVSRHLKKINKTTSKILNTIEKNKLNNKTSNKFLDYYLPVCVKIIDRYDEIENQELTSKDSKKYMDSSIKMIKETSLAFDKILDSLYQNDIYNNEAEMKVYNQMLKSDGYNSSELEVKDGDTDE